MDESVRFSQEPEMHLLPLGTVFNRLISADKREIEQNFPSRSKGATAEAMDYLLRHVKQSSNAVDVCIPLLEHIVKSRESNKRKKALFIIQSLYQTNECGIEIAKSLVHILSSPQFDHSIKLGGCLVIKHLLATSTTPEWTSRVVLSMPILSTCVSQLVKLVRDASVKDGMKKHPTRLTVSAADCILVITKMFSMKDVPEEWNFILWSHLDNMIALVFELYEWNREARPLHATGLMQVKNHLLQLRNIAEGDVPVGVAVLKSCWHEYASLMLSEAFKQDSVVNSLHKLLSALQQYMSYGRVKMHLYILNCFALLIGRLDAEQADNILADHEARLLELLLGQFSRNEEEKDGVVLALLRYIIFRDSSRLDSLAPLLIEFLNKRDTTSKAAVHLVAEYFLQHPSPDLQKVFSMLDSNEATQRRKAIDVIGELCSTSNSLSLSNTIAVYLLNRLDDEELTNRTAASNFFEKLDPTFVIPALIKLLYDSNEKVRSAASAGLVNVLKGSANHVEVVSVLLDCALNISIVSRPPKHPGEIGSSLPNQQADLDRIIRLVPPWASTVKDWETFVIFLLNKMFNDPSNPVLPRFLSEISIYLFNMYPIIFTRTLEEMLKYTRKDEQDDQHKDIFGKLSPLLVLKVMPLSAYDHIDFSQLYSGTRQGCITSLLLNWMCESTQSDDVRRLSAELVGRLHPEVMLPLLVDRFKGAVRDSDILKAKACIYAVCNSLMVRGYQTLSNSFMSQIRALLTKILLLPPQTEEVQKAQHGCIDCFAIAIRTELKETDQRHMTIDGEHKVDSVLLGVISGLEDHTRSIPSLCGMPTLEFSTFIDEFGIERHDIAPISFRLCNVNVLISSTSKIPVKSHELFRDTVYSVITNLLKIEEEAIVRAAYIQLLFSCVYNLKGASMVRYARDLLQISLAALERSNTLSEERLAGGKLLAALLAEESLMEEIGSSLVHIRQVVSSISLVDPSPEVRQLCNQLLNCVS